MNEKESRKEDSINVYVSYSDSGIIERLKERLKERLRESDKTPMSLIAAGSLIGSFRHSTQPTVHDAPVANADSYHVTWSIESEESPIIAHDDLKEAIGKNLSDAINDALQKALGETEEKRARVMLDSCMVEIEDIRRRMQEDQEDIDQLTIEMRTILKQLQSA